MKNKNKTEIKCPYSGFVFYPCILKPIFKNIFLDNFSIDMNGKVAFF